jgi:lysozyme
MDQLRFTAYHEGFVPHVYKDSLGHWTIGFGHKLVTPLEVMLAETWGDNMQIEQPRALELLEIDMRVAQNDFAKIFVYNAVKNQTPINEARKIALTDMLFNLGQGQFLQFRNTIRCVRSGDWHGAAMSAMKSKWAGQVGKRARRIAYLLETGEFPQVSHTLALPEA